MIGATGKGTDNSLHLHFKQKRRQSRYWQRGLNRQWAKLHITIAMQSLYYLQFFFRQIGEQRSLNALFLGSVQQG